MTSDPSLKQCQSADSVHVLAFSSKGDLLLVESEGEFNLDVWENVFAEASRMCRGDPSHDGGDEDVSMDSEDATDAESFLRGVVGAKFARDQRWKESVK